jgi:Recombination endonuclease VII
MAAAKFTTAFIVHPSCRRGRNIYRSCWPCLARSLAQWGYDVDAYHREAMRQYVRECSRRASPATKQRNAQRKKRYGSIYRYNLTYQQHQTMLQEQKGLCALCGKQETVLRKGKTQALSIDHDHATGRVRGLLCARCNMALFMLETQGKSWLLHAELYLEAHGSFLT